MNDEQKEKTAQGGGDFVGRDKRITAGEGSVVIDGNVTGSTVVTGSHNAVGAQGDFFQVIYRAIDERPDLSPADKADLKVEVQEIEAEVKKGDQADESFLAHRLRNIKRIAPDIVDVVLAALGNPIAGFGMVAKKVVERMKLSAG